MAWQSGAVERLRGFPSPDVLLRMLMLHVARGYSLRETVVRAQHSHDFLWNENEPHTHEHAHPPLRHAHPHYPDVHHRHSHCGDVHTHDSGQVI